MISERREPLAVSFCISHLKRDVLPLNITKLAKSLPKSLKKSGGGSSGDRMPIRWSLTGLLRVRRERPCGRSTTEKPDEISSLHVCPRVGHAMCDGRL